MIELAYVVCRDCGCLGGRLPQRWPSSAVYALDELSPDQPGPLPYLSTGTGARCEERRLRGAGGVTPIQDLLSLFFF